MQIRTAFACLLFNLALQVSAGNNPSKHAEIQTTLPPVASQTQGESLQWSLQQHSPYEVHIVSAPQKDRYDKVAVWINAVLAVIGMAGIGIAIGTLLKIKQQTAATEIAAVATAKQAAHMVASERPFIIVETRGTLNSEFWMKNWGRSPAQILFFDPVLFPHIVDWVQERGEFEMPGKPNYGPHYYDDQWEQINVQWLGPGEERYLTSFSPENLHLLPKEMLSEINMGHRAIRLYASIKYRGMFSPDIYHSRFCYGWGRSGTYMTGPHGYNQYT